jgi:hypothetical protein
MVDRPRKRRLFDQSEVEADAIGRCRLRPRLHPEDDWHEKPDLTMQKMIGQGTFGEVYNVMWQGADGELSSRVVKRFRSEVDASGLPVGPDQTALREISLVMVMSGLEGSPDLWLMAPWP